jgi:hypothetical protein
MFVSVILLPALALVIHLVVRASRAHADDSTVDSTVDSHEAAAPPPIGDVAAEPARWRSAGPLDDEQVTAILEHERLHRPAPSRQPPTRRRPRRPLAGHAVSSPT